MNALFEIREASRARAPDSPVPGEHRDMRKARPTKNSAAADFDNGLERPAVEGVDLRLLLSFQLRSEACCQI